MADVGEPKSPLYPTGDPAYTVTTPASVVRYTWEEDWSDINTLSNASTATPAGDTMLLAAPPELEDRYEVITPVTVFTLRTRTFPESQMYRAPPLGENAIPSGLLRSAEDAGPLSPPKSPAPSAVAVQTPAYELIVPV